MVWPHDSVFYFFFQVTSFLAQGAWAGESRSVCGRTEQWGGEARGILRLITFLGFKEKFTLCFAMCFIHKFSIGSRGCPHRHWCETGSIKPKRGTWEAEKLKVRSCFPAAQQNIADTGVSGSILKSQLGSILEKLLGTDASLFCGWDITAGKAVVIQRAPEFYSSPAVGLFWGRHLH